MNLEKPRISPLLPKRRRLSGRLESKEPRRRTLSEYQNLVRDQYDGIPGALTGVTGFFTGHEALAGLLFSRTKFDLRGCKRILDAGCGNGRYTRFVLRRADSDAMITAFDYSKRMLRRARERTRGDRISHVAADLTRLPYADASFDTIICGWVLEHLPDPRPGLRQLARVLQPGGKVLLLATEANVLGAVCSRMWHCRTYDRQELREACQESGLRWGRELWFSRVHERLRLGGIMVELRSA